MEGYGPKEPSSVVPFHENFISEKSHTLPRVASLFLFFCFSYLDLWTLRLARPPVNSAGNAHSLKKNHGCYRR